MPDREKVIRGLQNRINESRNHGGIAVHVALSTLSGALMLLKEQEPIAPKKPKTVYAYEFACGNCEACVDLEWIVCPWCGKGIKWNAAD